MRIQSFAIAAVTAVLQVVAEAQGVRALTLQRHSAAVQAPTRNNLVAADVNGDAYPEIIACGDAGPYALESAGGAYRVFWRGPSVACGGIAAGDVNGDGATEIVVGTSSGWVLIYDPRAANHKASFTLPGNAAIRDVVIGNADDDASLEIVVVTTGATYVYDGKLLTLQWTASGYGGTSAAIGQIDGNARLEIVVNGAIGSVLDAQAQSRKWNYSGGFGTAMVLGNIDADSYDEIVFVNGPATSITVLNGDTLATSTVTSANAIETVATGDGDRDGAGEIIVGGGTSKVIAALDPTTSDVRWSVDNVDRRADALLVADTDGDGAAEVVWGNADTHAFIVASAVTHAVEWQNADLGVGLGSAGVDLEADGFHEWLVATAPRTLAGRGLLEIVDPTSGVARSSMPAYPANASFPAAGSIAAGQLDADPANEICIPVPSATGATLRVVDGFTLAEEWVGTTTFSGGRFFLRNVDDDTVEEIIGPTTDGGLVVLNGASNVVQSSRSSVGAVVDLAVADTDGDGTPELIVATAARLSVYALPALTLRVDLPLSDIVKVAASSAGGGTIAVAFSSGARLRTYAAATLAPNWSCTGFDADSFTAMAAVVIDGSATLLVTNSDGLLRSFALGGTPCIASEVSGVPVYSDSNFTVQVPAGTVRPDLLVKGRDYAEIVLLGSSAKPRGDVNGDSRIDVDDATIVAAYALGAYRGNIRASGDVDADGRIGVEDAFRLIDHAVLGGAAPQP